MAITLRQALNECHQAEVDGEDDVDYIVPGRPTLHPGGIQVFARKGTFTLDAKALAEGPNAFGGIYSARDTDGDYHTIICYRLVPMEE